MYAMTNAAFGTEADPGVGAFLWAQSRSVALRIYERHPDGDAAEFDSRCSPLPVSAIGFSPLTFGGVLGEAKRRGELPQVSATYALLDGQFVSSEIRFAGREFVFASANPGSRDPVVAVRFNLSG